MNLNSQETTRLRDENSEYGAQSICEEEQETTMSPQIISKQELEAGINHTFQNQANGAPTPNFLSMRRNNNQSRAYSSDVLSRYEAEEKAANFKNAETTSLDDQQAHPNDDISIV